MEDMNLFRDSKIKVITFQSKEVLDILLRDGVYYANIAKCRENNDYKEDIDSLNGSVPVWVFSNPNINFNSLKSGSLLESWRCEMSLDQHIGLAQFLMLELLVNEDDLKIGKTHNSYKYSSIMPNININQLCAVYRIENTGHYFYKRIVLYKKYRSDVDILTDSYIDTREINTPGLYKCDNAKDNYICSYCDGHTSNLIGNIPICSEFCKDKILYMCKKSGIKSFVNKCDSEIFNMITKTMIRNLKFEYYDKIKEELGGDKI